MFLSTCRYLTMQSDKAWSQTAINYSSDSMIKVPEFYASVSAGLLLQDLPTDGSIRFLDVAAGLGTVTTKVLEHLTPEQREASTIDVTDFSEGMVEKAESRISSEEAYAKVTKKLQVMNGQDLKFPDNTFSHIGCQFGIMFYPDRALGLSEMYRVLQPDGKAVIGTWHYTDNLTLLDEFAAFLGLTDVAEGRAAMVTAMEACGEPEVFQQELAAAGFTEIAIQKVDKTFTLPNDEGLFLAFATNAAMKWAAGGVHNYPQWQEFLKTVGAKWINAEGRVSLRFVANMAVARK